MYAGLERDVIFGRVWLLAIILSSLAELISFDFEHFAEFCIGYRKRVRERERERETNAMPLLCLLSVIPTFVCLFRSFSHASMYFAVQFNEK